MKREKKTAQAAGASPAGRPNREKRRGAVGSPPAPRPQGSPPGGAGKGSANGDSATREVVHGGGARVLRQSSDAAPDHDLPLWEAGGRIRLGRLRGGV